MLWDSEHFLVQVVIVFTSPTSKKEVKNTYRLEGSLNLLSIFILRNQTQTHFFNLVIFRYMRYCLFTKHILHVHISFIWYLFFKTHFNNRTLFFEFFKNPVFLFEMSGTPNFRKLPPKPEVRNDPNNLGTGTQSHGICWMVPPIPTWAPDWEIPIE